jgi:rRNA maturation RNase YbeY
MEEINFFKEDLAIDLRKLKRFKKWVIQVAKTYKEDVESINYIFCSDAFLHKINVAYLQHDTLTDIITFDLREKNTHLPIEADIFISIERVNDNSVDFNQNFEQELGRVIIHGLLHLIGFTDKNDQEKQRMREAENAALLQL